MPTFITVSEEQAAQREKELAEYSAAQSRAIAERDRRANEAAGREYQASMKQIAASEQADAAAMRGRELQVQVGESRGLVESLSYAVTSQRELREIERELADAERSLLTSALIEARPDAIAHIVRLRTLVSMWPGRLDILKGRLANEQARLKSLEQNLAEQTSLYEKAKTVLSKLVS
jgi:hypothetical protein